MPCEAAQRGWWAKERSLHPGVWLRPKLTPPEESQMSPVCAAMSLAQVQLHCLSQLVLSM